MVIHLAADLRHLSHVPLPVGAVDRLKEEAKKTKNIARGTLHIPVGGTRVLAYAAYNPDQNALFLAAKI